MQKFRTSLGGPVVTFIGSADGLRVQCATPDVAIEYCQPGAYQTAAVRVALDALEVCEGRDDSPVAIAAVSDKQALLSWIDRGVPRQPECEQPKANSTTFPELPNKYAENDPSLWRGLAEAVATTDSASARYALGCLHFRGKLGRVDATDGRNALAQRGYRFGFDDDLLVPGSKILGCSDLDLGEPFGLGRAGQWVGVKIGPWQLALRVQNGRFPKVDGIFPAPESASSRLELTATDAAFLAETLPRLPDEGDEHFSPITFDLNGQVLVRARENDKARPTEVRLAGSKLVGEPVTINTNRFYVERALKLGFQTVHLFGPDRALLCTSDARRYLWMPLNTESAIKPAADAIRIESSCSHAAINRVQGTKEEPVAVSSTQPPPTSTTVKPHNGAPVVKRPHPRPVASTIEQAVALRDALRNVAQQAGELARSLRHQKRQTRIVESTLASLKQLQRVAG